MGPPFVQGERVMSTRSYLCVARRCMRVVGGVFGNRMLMCTVHAYSIRRTFPMLLSSATDSASSRQVHEDGRGLLRTIAVQDRLLSCHSILRFFLHRELRLQCFDLIPQHLNLIILTQHSLPSLHQFSLQLLHEQVV